MKRLGLFFVIQFLLLKSLSASASIDAVYIVPTEDVLLKPHATFSLQTDHNEYGSPESSGVFNFHLPVELTGVDQSFQLTKTAGGAWLGPGVAGECAVQDSDWFVCQVAFEKIDGTIQFDSKKRDEILHRQFQNSVEIARRLEVARSFEGQPIGIIKIRRLSAQTEPSFELVANGFGRAEF